MTGRPDPGASSAAMRSPRKRLRHVAVRVLLSTLAIAVVAAPFLASWSHDVARRAVSAQVAAPGSHDRTLATSLTKADASAPVVLAYHDINPRPGNRYTLTPQQLDAQLSALKAAGYRSLSTEMFIRYLRTGRAPAPRSVYLTFDDGTRGLWAYADPILAKHRMRAAAYLITGMVGTHRPYYLSWQEIDRMSSSARWDFQDHTHLSHSRLAVDSTGRKGSALANRIWLSGPKRLETESEYRSRISLDLDRSLRAFREHGLPAPQLFAYPYSETTAPTNLVGRSTSALEKLLRDRFTATLTNTSSRPLPAGPRAALQRQVQRLEVLRNTSKAALLRRLGQWTSRSAGDPAEPLGHPDQWQFPDGPQDSDLTAVTGKGLAHGTYASAVHLPLATADWRAYRVTATADRLSGSATGVSIEMGHGSLSPCTLTVSATGLRVSERPIHGKARITTRRLTESSARRITLRVSPREKRITVDGTTVVITADPPVEPAAASGGLMLAVRNEAGERPWPRFTSLHISP